MRQRVEDLGILAEKLDNLLQSDIFDEVVHDEHFCEHYKHADRLDILFYQLRYLKDQLHECWQWARYGDEYDGDQPLKV